MKVFSNSKLVVGQVRGDLEAHIQECRSTCAKSGAYKKNLKFLTCLIFIEVGTHMQTHWLPSLRPRRRICPEWYWLKTYIHLLQYTMVCLGSTKSNWVRVGWILYHYSWKKIYCLKRSPKLRKCVEKLLGFGCPRIENCISILSLVLICFVYTPRHQNHS